jgi:hypothetical protein
VFGGPRTVRTDLFAAIALQVLTLFVLLYTASLLAVMHPSCGRLGCAVAVGMGNTLGSGETGRKCMFISPGVATRGLTGVQCGIRNDHNVVCARMRCSVTTISRGRNRLWPSGLQYRSSFYCSYRNKTYLMPGACKLHGPASHCALAFLLDDALRSAGGNTYQYEKKDHNCLVP